MSEPWQHLAPRARWLFHLQAIVGLVMVQLPMSMGLALAISFLTHWTYGLGIGATVAFAFIVAALWMPTLSFDRWRYCLRADDLLIERGVLVRRLTSIPYSRIQHVDTQQGPMERWFGLARIQVFSASGIGADGVVLGLDHAEAEALRDALVERGGGDDGL